MNTKKSILVIFVILITIMAFAYALLFHQNIDPNKAHGTVDIQDSLLSFERPGKIIALNVDEGSNVKENDILATLDSKELDHQMRIQYAQCQAEQSLLNQYQNGYLKEEIDSAKATVQKSQAAVDLAAITYERNRSLLNTKSISKQDFDSAKASYNEAKASLLEAMISWR